MRQSVGHRRRCSASSSPLDPGAYAWKAKAAKNYAVIRRWLSRSLALRTSCWRHLADAIATYVRYQIDSGARWDATVRSWAASQPPSITTFRRPLPETGGGSGGRPPTRHPPDLYIFWQCRGAGALWLTPGSISSFVGLDRDMPMPARLPEHLVCGQCGIPGLLFGTPGRSGARGGRHVCSRTRGGPATSSTSATASCGPPRRGKPGCS